MADEASLRAAGLAGEMSLPAAVVLSGDSPGMTRLMGEASPRAAGLPGDEGRPPNFGGER